MFEPRRRFLSMASVAPLALSRPARAGEVSTLGGRAFGSYWRISCAGSGAGIRARVEKVIASVDAAMSPYRADSEISRFNASPSTGWVPVSHPTGSVVAAALSIARQCDGYFDPTVGPLVGRYGFGPITGSRGGDYRQLAVHGDAIRKDDGRVSLDLCGIAKGHALERIVAALDAAGVARYLVELGGEVFARGAHPSGRPWQVAIEDPRVEASGLAHVVALDGLAIATSGNRTNGYDVAGRRYGHIVDPISESCVATALLSVSVVARRATLADGLATGMMAMGAQRARAFADRHGVDALLLVREGERLKSVTTGRFASRLLG